MGPVSVSAAIVLLIAAPLMRGGNRHIAMIGLEAIALLLLLSLCVRAFVLGKVASHHLFIRVHTVILAAVVLSPAWLALVYLLPIPSELWADLSGRDIYLGLAADARIVDLRRTLSLVPDVTTASLLAGLPLIAAFIAGNFCGLQQLKLLLTCVVGIALMQVLLGLLQIAGGPESMFYVGALADRPVGTFANPNHFANYVAMATSGYIWLGWKGLFARHPERMTNGRLHAGLNTQAVWIAGGVFLVVGILMSRSRGAAFAGLPAAMLAVCVVVLTGGRRFTWSLTLGLIAAVFSGAVSLIGLDSILSRFDPATMTNDAQARDLLTSTTMQGATTFWPWGAGWGTYAAVYPRFQSGSIAAYVDYAHHDYAQMLFEGGVFAVLIGVCSLCLVVTRAARLTRSVLRNREFSPDEMAATLCGIGLMGFLLHSLVEFNMHIPANAILGALLAGAFLRPLTVTGMRDD